MTERASTVSRAWKHVTKHPMVVLFGAISAAGGVISILGLITNAAVNSILLADGLRVVGPAFLQHAVAIAIGAVLSFLVILLVSGFAQGILLRVAGGHFHEEDDVWYGALRRGAACAVPLAVIWLLFYLVSAIFTFGVYHLALVVLSAIASETVSAVISAVAIVVMAFLVLLFAIIAMNASCFVSIFRLKTGKALASGFDLFAQMPMRSVGMMLILMIFWIIGFALVIAVCAAILLIGTWLAHFVVSGDRLGNFLNNGLSSDGLLITILLGILFLTNAALTAFGNTAWALFFLEHVSSIQLPKNSKSHETMRSTMPEAETA